MVVKRPLPKIRVGRNHKISHGWQSGDRGWRVRTRRGHVARALV